MTGIWADEPSAAYSIRPRSVNKRTQSFDNFMSTWRLSVMAATDFQPDADPSTATPRETVFVDQDKDEPILVCFSGLTRDWCAPEMIRQNVCCC